MFNKCARGQPGPTPILTTAWPGLKVVLHPRPGTQDGA